MALVNTEVRKLEDLPLVLALDVSGQPSRWITYTHSCYYYSKELVAWNMGEINLTLFGGTNAKTGLQSTLTMNTIIAIKGQTNGKRRKHHRHVPPLNNRALFRRDKNICAYCGNEFRTALLTRDHVIPKARGGKDIWSNVVAACGSCNKRKDDKSPEQAHMQLLYVPYAPSRHEWLILENRRILFDQQEFLMKGVPKESRLHG